MILMQFFTLRTWFFTLRRWFVVLKNGLKHKQNRTGIKIPQHLIWAPRFLILRYPRTAVVPYK